MNLVAEGRHAHHRFAPSLRCARIITWGGVEHLQLGKIADVELIDRGSGAIVDPDRHIGTLTRRGHGTLELELRRVRHDVHIVVNATRHTVAAGSISFDAVVALAIRPPRRARTRSTRCSTARVRPPIPSAACWPDTTSRCARG